MRYRRLDKAGDYTLGRGSADMLINSPETVSQAVITRLRLLSGEWFLDLFEGTPYISDVWGKHTKDTADPVLRRRILETEGVTAITSYESQYDPERRKLTVSVELDTLYGAVQVEAAL